MSAFISALLIYWSMVCKLDSSLACVNIYRQLNLPVNNGSEQPKKSIKPTTNKASMVVPQTDGYKEENVALFSVQTTTVSRIWIDSNSQQVAAANFVQRHQ